MTADMIGLLRVVAVLALLAMDAFAVVPSLNVCQKVPGGKGAISECVGGHVLSYDFTDGGSYVEMVYGFGEQGIRLDSVHCRIKGGKGQLVQVHFIDYTGQNFIKYFRLPCDGWRTVRILPSGCKVAFGGADDRKMHMPFKSMAIGVHKSKGQSATGGLSVTDVRFVELIGFAFDHVQDSLLHPIRIDGKIAWEKEGIAPPKALSAMVTNMTDRALRGLFVLEVRDWDGNRIRREMSPVLELSPNGRAEHSFPLPPIPADKKFAEYSVSFVGEDGTRVPSFPWSRAWTSPVAGEVVPRAAPELPWGMGAYLVLQRMPDTLKNRERIARNATLVRNMGAKWIREEFSWSRIEPEKGKLDLALYDYMVDVAVSNGLTVVGLFAYWTKWTKPWTDEGCEDYCRMLSRLVSRYRGRVDRWEIYNEPDIDPWKGKGEQYYRLLSLAYEAVKTANPKAEVWGFATSGVGRGFIEPGVAAGVRFDRISVHPYTSTLIEKTFLDDISWLYGKSGDHRIGITEIGWSTWRGGASERSQAVNLARAQMTAAASDKVAVFVPYTLFDGPNFDMTEGNYGVVRGDSRTIKPAYRALTKVFRTFSHGPAKIDFRQIGNDIEAIVFTMDGKSVVYTDYDRPVVLEIEGGGSITAVNLMDEPVALSCTSGKVRFISDIGHPIFFSGEVRNPVFVSAPEPVD